MAFLSLGALLALFIPQYTVGQFAETKNDTGCRKPADVIFVVDASSSIWGPDFRKQLDFVRAIIRDLRIDPSMVRCGLVTYGDDVRVEFGLLTYSSAETAMKAVSLVGHLRGSSTRTDKALRRMMEIMEADKRPGIPQIGIVLTDGQSDYPAATRQEAEMAHEAGIALIAVGIGREVDQRELRAIASQESFRFNVGSFDGLQRIRGILTTKACEVQTQNDQAPEPSLLQNNEGCADKLADVMFVLDGSGSVWGPDFRSQLRFVSDMVALYQVSESGTHVGVVTFGDHPMPQFALDRYSTVSDVQSAVKRIAQQMGGTNTADALRYVRETSFTGRRHRVGAIKIAMVITDGQSNDPVSTTQEATRLKDDEVTVFAIGVGSGADKTELYSIASYPSDQHVFMVENYAALDSIKQHLMSRACLRNRLGHSSPPPAFLHLLITATKQTSTEQRIPSTQSTADIAASTAPGEAIDCQSMQPADIVFSLPSSIDDQETSLGLRFIESLGKTLGLGDGQIRLGLAPRLCHAISGFSLEQGNRSDKVSRYVEEQSPSGRVDETAAMLRYLRDVSFRSQGEAPVIKETAKIAVVVVDRRSARLTQATFREAKRLMQKGIRVLVIVVGKRTVSFDEDLSQLTDCEYCLLRADSYSGLHDLVEPLKKMAIAQLCTTVRATDSDSN